eukprot:SAG31_NODE_2483_length_5627_cov_3.161390_4_plen_122_part_00
MHQPEIFEILCASNPILIAKSNGLIDLDLQSADEQRCDRLSQWVASWANKLGGIGADYVLPVRWKQLVRLRGSVHIALMISTGGPAPFDVIHDCHYNTIVHSYALFEKRDSVRFSVYDWQT